MATIQKRKNFYGMLFVAAACAALFLIALGLLTRLPQDNISFVEEENFENTDFVDAEEGTSLPVQASQEILLGDYGVLLPSDFTIRNREQIDVVSRTNDTRRCTDAEQCVVYEVSNDGDTWFLVTQSRVLSPVLSDQSTENTWLVNDFQVEVLIEEVALYPEEAIPNTTFDAASETTVVRQVSGCIVDNICFYSGILPLNEDQNDTLLKNLQAFLSQLTFSLPVS